MAPSEPVTPPPVSPFHDVRAIAYHEAGHVVVGTRLGLEVLGADIESDGDGGRGHTHFANPPGRDREFVERVVTTFMAGFAAEGRIGVADPEGSGFDLDLTLREWLAHLEPDPGRRSELVHQFYERAAAELEQPGVWHDVEAVAAALLASTRLDGAAAAGLVTSGPARPSLPQADPRPDPKH